MPAAADFFLGIDIGTSATKVLLVRDDGRPLARASAAYPVHWPRPGWAEQEAEAWWRATVEAVRSCLAQAGVDAGRIAALSLSGQMHGAVLLDRAGNVVRPPILWCDVRTAKQCREMTERAGGRAQLLRLAANPALEGFTAPKLLWLREEEPESFRAARTLLLPKDYVRFRLTGEPATDVSDASGTLLYDVVRGEWCRPLLDVWEIPAQFLPPVLPSHAVAGRISSEAAQATGLRPGTPVVAGGADNACGAVGAGVVRDGLFLSSIGSSGVVLTPMSSPWVDPEGRVHTFRHAVEGHWYAMGVTLAAGLSLRWFRDHLAQAELAVERAGGPDAYDLLAAEAVRSPAGSRGLYFLPYLSGERTPHADADARGVFFGISAAHTRADMVRAVFEGITYALRDSIEILRASGRTVREVRAIGGGAKSPFWRQLQADVFGADVVTPAVDEGPAYGAALLAMVGAGRFATVQEAAETCVRPGGRTAPSAERGVYDSGYAFYRSLYPALKDRFAALARVGG